MTNTEDARQLATEIAAAYAGPGTATVVEDRVLGGPVVRVTVARTRYLLTVGPEGSLHAILLRGLMLTGLDSRRGDVTAEQTAAELTDAIARVAR